MHVNAAGADEEHDLVDIEFRRTRISSGMATVFTLRHPFIASSINTFLLAQPSIGCVVETPIA